MSLAEKIKEYNSKWSELHDKVEAFLLLTIGKQKIKVRLAVLNPHDSYAPPIEVNWVSKDGTMTTEDDNEPIDFHLLPTQDLLYILEEIILGEFRKTTKRW